MAGVEVDDLANVYFDTDVIISGCRSSVGASYVLLRVAEFRLIKGCTSDFALAEAQRHVAVARPRARAAFLRLTRGIFAVPGVAPPLSDLAQLHGQADPKDLPHLASARAQGCRYLATFNVRHYQPSGTTPQILRPGEILELLRSILAQYAG